MKIFKVLLWQNRAKAKNGLAPIYARIPIQIYTRVLENKISNDMERLEDRLILKERNVI